MLLSVLVADGKLMNVWQSGVSFRMNLNRLMKLNKIHLNVEITGLRGF
jgi:hypothetical protein